MGFFTYYVLGWVAGSLILITTFAQPASAASPVTPNRATVLPSYGPAITIPERRPTINPLNPGSAMPGSDWWRTYPWSPYNAWKNPYWYPPYNTNYPYLPDQAYPYYPYPGPSPAPLPFPGGGIGSGHR